MGPTGGGYSGKQATEDSGTRREDYIKVNMVVSCK